MTDAMQRDMTNNRAALKNNDFLSRIELI